MATERLDVWAIFGCVSRMQSVLLLQVVITCGKSMGSKYWSKSELIFFSKFSVGPLYFCEAGLLPNSRFLWLFHGNRAVHIFCSWVNPTKIKEGRWTILQVLRNNRGTSSRIFFVLKTIPKPLGCSLFVWTQRMGVWTKYEWLYIVLVDKVSRKGGPLYHTGLRKVCSIENKCFGWEMV